MPFSHMPHNSFGSDRLFRRCVQCPDSFLGTCPACAVGELCSIEKTQSCDQCASTFCVKVDGTVTTTVSVAVKTVTASFQQSSSSEVSKIGSQTSSTRTSSSTGLTQSGANSRQSLNAGPIAGAVIGVLCLLALVFGTIFFFRRRQRNRKPMSAQEMSQAGSYIPAGGRYELDPSHVTQPREVDAVHQIYELDGRGRPVEVG